MSHRIIHTLGHSNHPWQSFVNLLRTWNIETLVDVRSRPHSRFPWFNQIAMEAALPAEGLVYVWMGDRLGGRPTERALLDEAGSPDYAAMAASATFQKGIADLESLATPETRLALMCSEGDPARCHREYLIAPALRELGYEVAHILPDGSRLLV